MERNKMKITMKITKMKVKIITNLKFYLNFLLNSSRINFKYAYFLPFIFAKFNPNVTPESDPLVSYAFSMFLLNLIVFICFFNIIGYILSIYLVNKYDIEVKFPKYKIYINFYKSTSKFFLILEIIIAFVILIFLILLNLFLLTSLINK
jgi:hypothetical protein